jgi:hypothetical protein
LQALLAKQAPLAQKLGFPLGAVQVVVLALYKHVLLQHGVSVALV